MMALLAAISLGALVPIQTAINSRLRLSVGSALAASLISFFVGAVTLTCAATIIYRHPIPPLGLATGLPAWIWIGGVLGVVQLTANVLLFPRVGGVQTVVLPIIGSVSMGLVIDHEGLFHVPQVLVDAPRILGALLVIGGVALVVRRSSATAQADGAVVWGWRAFGVAAGMCQGAQVAINGQLGLALGSALSAAQVSFSVGFLSLLLIVLLTRSWPRATGQRGTWWMWLGGVLGTVIIAGGSFLAPILGTGASVVAMLLGTMALGQLIDALGVLGARKTPVRAAALIGLAVIVLGVFLVRVV